MRPSQSQLFDDSRFTNGNTDFDPLFAINVLFSKMRNYMARLGRKYREVFVLRYEQ